MRRQVHDRNILFLCEDNTQLSRWQRLRRNIYRRLKRVFSVPG